MLLFLPSFKGNIKPPLDVLKALPVRETEEEEKLMRQKLSNANIA